MWEDCSHFYFICMNALKILDVYIDESGDFSLYSKENPLYSVAFIFVDNCSENNGPISKFNGNLNNLIGGDHFVHVGNLIRGEKPYEEMLREERWKLFYALYLFAYFAKYKVIVSTIVKDEKDSEIVTAITKALINSIEDCIDYLNSFDEIVLHYDYGQGILAGIITGTFLSMFTNCKIVKTPQSQNPYMQLADLFAYFELLQYKMSKSYLTKSETRFFGGIRNLRDKVIHNLERKYLIKYKKYQ